MLKKVDQYICDTCGEEEFSLEEGKSPYGWEHLVAHKEFTTEYGYTTRMTRKFDFCSMMCAQHWIKRNTEWKILGPGQYVTWSRE